MSSLFSKALVYLGLVDEDQMDPTRPIGRLPGPSRSRRRVEAACGAISA